MGKGLSMWTKVYLAGVAFAAVACAAMLWNLPLGQPAGPLAFAVITSLAALAHCYPIRGPRHQAYQATLPFIVLAAATFSVSQLAAFILLIHLAEQLRVRRVWYIQLFNVNDYFLAALSAALLYHAASRMIDMGALGRMEAALGAATAFVLCNRILLAGALWLARNLSPARSGLFKPGLLAADLVITWIAAPMLVLTLEGGTWMIVLCLGPLFLARPALAYLLQEEEVQPGRHQEARAA
jgi:hypothetical protein